MVVSRQRPADLALNLCQAVLRGLGHEGPRLAYWQGDCFAAAWAMHQAAKHGFIAPLPVEGGRIPFTEVAQWVAEKLAQLEPREEAAWT